ncbi:hypothetical protein ISO99_00365 [Staphylococcus sp. 18_1_E_LY]|uniref:Uncharacterized protein n=1 Tax=Staphylococcus lloydii TaxID=2781774 RepID=A0A7T1FA94_9STAP|nr:hypothetical protein [Staphylococcus lloydii]MBF7018346.1 hypothetical protein [Staphylococcus lloydii]MBF7026074.1 hypothetical protein [Staphylococcus lloydii]QPM76097.1 hypothetical protein ISP08_05225 [Staphylococcus lloydii]
MDKVTHPEFEQYQKHIDTRFDNIDNNINEIKTLLRITSRDLCKKVNSDKLEVLDTVDDKIEASIIKMKYTQNKWFIISIIAIGGMAGRIFGFY